MADSPTTCPFCNDSILIPEEFIGSEVECPNCHKQFMIPKVMEEEDTSSLVVIDCPSCGAQNTIEEDFTGSIKCRNCDTVLDISVDNMIRCPFCGKEIPEKDTTCMYCQREIQNNAVAQEKKVSQSKAVPAQVVQGTKMISPGGMVKQIEKEDFFVLAFINGMKIATIVIFALVLFGGTAAAIMDWEHSGKYALAVIFISFCILLFNFFFMCWLRGLYINVMRIRDALEKKSDSKK